MRRGLCNVLKKQNWGERALEKWENNVRECSARLHAHLRNLKMFSQGSSQLWILVLSCSLLAAQLVYCADLPAFQSCRSTDRCVCDLWYVKGGNRIGYSNNKLCIIFESSNEHRVLRHLMHRRVGNGKYTLPSVTQCRNEQQTMYCNKELLLNFVCLEPVSWITWHHAVLALDVTNN